MRIQDGDIVLDLGRGVEFTVQILLHRKEESPSGILIRLGSTSDDVGHILKQESNLLLQILRKCTVPDRVRFGEESRDFFLAPFINLLLVGKGIDALGIRVTTGAKLESIHWAQDWIYETEFEQQKEGWTSSDSEWEEKPVKVEFDLDHGGRWTRISLVELAARRPGTHSLGYCHGKMLLFGLDQSKSDETAGWRGLYHFQLTTALSYWLRYLRLATR
ncbi:hypothetical protein Tco_0466287 [Tanacetum coccineum]